MDDSNETSYVTVLRSGLHLTGGIYEEEKENIGYVGSRDGKDYFKTDADGVDNLVKDLSLFVIGDDVRVVEDLPEDLEE